MSTRSCECLACDAGCDAGCGAGCDAGLSNGKCMRKECI